MSRIIAMWSGPRNLSTAMMRSFGARSDCQAVDEPFYAAYLAATGLEHPMRAEIIAAGESDPEAVIEQCINPAPDAKPLVYQKHMTHHMIDGVDTGWIAKVANVFLIRSPARVLASYAVKTEQVEAADIGFTRQRELFDLATEMQGERPPVLDAADIRANPEEMLKALCKRLDIPFQANMLAWTPGLKPEDGVWAKHWYGAVETSTGFAAPDTSPEPDLPPPLKAIEAEVRADYDYMRQFRLGVDG